MSRKLTASLITEYAVILSIAFMAIIAMNTYMKRGLQGRIKEMSDNFISPQQVADINTGESSSNTTNVMGTISSREGFLGGSTKTNVDDKREITSQSRVVDERAPLVEGEFVSSASGNVVISQRPRIDYENFTDQDIAEVENVLAGLQERLKLDESLKNAAATEHVVDETSVNIEQLTRSRDVLLRQRNGLLESARALEAEASELRQIPNTIDCPGGRRGRSCRRARARLAVDLAAKADELLGRAAANRVSAGELETQANALQQRIDTLSAEDGP
jgi:hypothetical protein